MNKYADYLTIFASWASWAFISSKSPSFSFENFPFLYSSPSQSMFAWGWHSSSNKNKIQVWTLCGSRSTVRVIPRTTRKSGSYFLQSQTGKFISDFFWLIFMSTLDQLKTEAQEVDNTRKEKISLMTLFPIMPNKYVMVL